MKKLILAFLLVLFITVPAFAASLVWDASTGQVNGYIVYFGPTSGDHAQYHYDNGTDTSCDMSNLNLVPGIDYTFTVRAWNTAGESGDSNSVTYTVPAYSPPANVLPTAVDVPAPAGNLTQS